MANPQIENGFTAIAREITEQLMVSQFTEQQRRMLDLVLRLSWGCGKKTATIPHQRDFEVVGVHEGHIKRHIDWLINARVITRNDTEYSFNKDYDQWRVSRSIGYSPERLTELVKINLNHNHKTYEKRKLLNNGKLTENVSKNLRKTEETAYRKRKFPTPNLATRKDILNTNKDNILDIDTNLRKKKRQGRPAEDPDKYTKGRYGHMVQQ